MPFIEFSQPPLTWRKLLRCSGGIDRKTYLIIGLCGLALKMTLDLLVSNLLFHRHWSPVEYIAPGSSLAMLFTMPAERNYYGAMVLIALPFIGLGISLTAMRLQSVGLSRGWTVLFFVPGVNFLIFALLTMMPRQTLIPLAEIAAVSPDPESPVPVLPTPVLPADVQPLGYARDGGQRTPWFDRYLPRDPANAKALAVFVPVPIALGVTFLSVHVLRDYGWGVFVGVPFAIGLMAAVLYAARTRKGYSGCIGVGCLSLTVYGIALLFSAMEGAGCLIMAAPLAYPITILGAVVGASLGAARVPDGRRVVGVMLVALPLLTGAERLTIPDAPLYAVTSSVEISGTPEQVWGNVIRFGQIPPPMDWVFQMGVAYPLRATIDGHGPGAMRHCVFSTGAFDEPITEWDEPRLLKFSVTSNPPPMKEWSPYGGIHPPHLENFLVSNGGQFHLIELPNGHTRVEGTTWYRHNMWPADYWRLWSDFIIHRIHLRVLNHIKVLTEQG